MKKTRIKTTILTLLAILVIISLVGCVKMQKPAEKEKVSPVDEDVEDIAGDVDDVEEMTEEVDEAEEVDEEIEEMAEEETEEVEEEETLDDGIPVKEYTEGDLVSFPNLKATDPDGDPITYEFTEPLDANGTWQTKVGDAGEYVITITASDGKNKATQKVKLVINSLNKAPEIVLEEAEIEVNEGEKIELKVQANDPDGDALTLRYEGWMKGPVKETTYYDSGEHFVTITASDGQAETNKTIRIIVNNVNRAPKLEGITDVVLTEGEKVTVKPMATDPDGDTLTFSFSKPLDTDGTWETEEGDAGTYRANVTATDGDLTATVGFFIIVESMNEAPVIELEQAEISVEEGDLVSIDATITDPEEDELTITYSGWMTTNTYQTDYDDAGTHVVTITVTDGINEVTQDVTVIVRDKNRPPVFDPSAFN